MLDPRDHPAFDLRALFLTRTAEHTDMNEHLGILWGLARQCEHVTEFGVRDGVSTTALLMAQPERLCCYDRDRCPVVDDLVKVRGRTVIQFVQTDSRHVEIAPTDMLHIDTIHAYSCLSIELQKHAPRVRRWIAMHDTAIYGERGDDKGDGMNKAIDELIDGGKWTVWAIWPHSFGMTVIQRIAEE